MLQPMAALGVGKWLVVFCDEINLPAQVQSHLFAHRGLTAACTSEPHASARGRLLQPYPFRVKRGDCHV